MPQLTDPGDLISASWDNLVKNLSAYINFGILYVFLAVLQWAIFILFRSLIPDFYLRNSIITLTSIPVALATMAVTASLIAATYQGVQKRPVDVRIAFSRGLHQLLPYVWVSIIAFVVYLAGFIALIIPFFIFVVWFWFTQYFTIIDDVRGLKAFSASRKLVKGRWWPVAVRILLPAVFCAVAASFFKAILYLLIGSVLGDPGMFFGATVNEIDLSSTHLLITWVTPTLVNAFAIPLYIGTAVLLWLELKKTSGSN